ncbi:CGNR zinc finger domain-containing protein [Intrasporangium sp.]|uniref:CGNR zinc finger domain-containing protein n=1 Tax=Intrasporangium sp. TaxID=1925024 RepID=UPI00293B75D5|nr:CGNR zinc finger domain-containing protein [Intrasporangium sp.]MDV3221034.1 CGNR zinc finger domain-containing protein [Intrasporangium sp.]
MTSAQPLIGEHLALDLVNTRPLTEGGRADLLGTPEQLAAWLGLEPELEAEVGEATPTAADVAAVQLVRTQVDAVVQALLRGGPAPRPALQALTEAQRGAPAVRELTWDGAAVIATTRRQGTLGVRLAARLAEAAADLLTSPAAVRLKECEADDCVMLFVPAHPRRRWCSSARCGNRVRVSRHYHRHKPTDAVRRDQ